MTPQHHVTVTLTVNGEGVQATLPARTPLIDLLRDTLGLTATHLGCAHGVCGACTVRVDGQSVRACLMLAAQADGTRVDTLEGVSDAGDLADLQEAFHRHNALQCGFCTSGMLITAAELLDGTETVPDRATIRDHISGNYCRCTGYQAIVDAIEEVAHARQTARQTEANARGAA
jgi:aerobic carbon-monoxide dehydrogenase small subunit